METKPYQPVYLHEQLPYAELTCLMLWYPVGKFSEPLQAIGASELLEKEFTLGLQDWALSIGGCVGCNTANEHAYYYLLIPNRHLQEAADRIHKLLASDSLTPQDFELCKRELYNQYWKKIRFNDYALADLIVGRHFPAWPGTTFPERFLAIEALRYEAYRAFRRQAWLQTAPYLAYVGPAEASVAETALARMLPENPPRDSSTSENHPLTLQEPLALPSHACQFQQTAIGFGFKLGPLKPAHEIRWWLLTQILEMRQDRLLDSFFSPGRQFTYWLLMSRKFDGLPYFPFEEVVREAQAIIRTKEFHPQSLQRAKNMLERLLLEESEGVLGHAYKLCSTAYRGEVVQVENLAEVTSAELSDSLQSLLQQTPEYVAVSPEAGNPQRLMKDFVPLFEQRHAGAREGNPDLWQSIPNSILEMPAMQMSTSETAKTVTSNAKPTTYETPFGTVVEHPPHLYNGMQVISLHHPKHQLDYFGLYLKGGRIYENQSNCGISNLLFSSVLSSLNYRLDPRHQQIRFGAFNKSVEWMGGYVEADVTADISGMRGLILQRHSRRFLEEVVKNFFSPKLADGTVFQMVKQALTERTQARQHDLFHRTVDMFYQTVFGVHPYGLPRFGNERSLSSLSVRDLHSWHAGWVQPNRTTLVLLTSRTVDDAKELLHGLQLPNSENGNQLPAEILSMSQYAQLGSVKELENRQDRSSSLVIGFPVPFSRDENFPFKIDILQHALAGPAGLLMSDARRALFTRVKSFYVPLAKGGVFFLYTEYSGASTSMAKDPAQIHEIIHQQLDVLVQQGLDKLQLQRAKAYAIGSHQLALQAPLHYLYELSRCQLLYADAKRIHGYNESIQAVTAEALQVTAREIINPKRITAVMVKSAYEMV